MSVPDYADPRPVKVQIADDLRGKIRSGIYAPGSRLPSVRELAGRYHVVTGTVRDAVDILRREGLLQTRSTRGTYVLREPGTAEPAGGYEAVMSRLDDVDAEVRQLQERITVLEQLLLPGDPSSVPEPQPVVAAIVASAQGVLVARRHDGKPAWTFPAGEIEPGESPADAAVREVKEETGLEVRAGSVIGRRVHPETRRTMVYMAAAPAHGTDVHVGDPGELAEVRWVSLPEAEELMAGAMYEAVRGYLKGTLPEALR